LRVGVGLGIEGIGGAALGQAGAQAAALLGRGLGRAGQQRLGRDCRNPERRRALQEIAAADPAGDQLLAQKINVFRHVSLLSCCLVIVFQPEARLARAHKRYEG
jgi:hypothetical protein